MPAIKVGQKWVREWSETGSTNDNTNHAHFVIASVNGDRLTILNFRGERMEFTMSGIQHVIREFHYVLMEGAQ